MMSIATDKFHALRVEIPRGYLDYWRIIREMDAAGPWTIAMIVGRTRSHYMTVSRYVRRLQKAGIADIVGERAGVQPNKPKLYRLASIPVEAPRLRDDGSACLPTEHEQMWRAVRTLQQFDVPELAFTASTDVVCVSKSAAKSFIARLSAAGYLTCVQAGNGGTAARRAVWRLKPAMNTGPLPPIFMRTKFVWDANRQEIVGSSVLAEEAR